MTCPHPATIAVTLDNTAYANATDLYLKTHGLNYSTQGSFRINNSPWVRMKNQDTGTVSENNPTVVVLGSGNRYGGIGGAFTVVKFKVSLSTPMVSAGNAQLKTFLTPGANNISFCFNGTDKRSSGYRVIDINLWDSTGVGVTLASGTAALIPYEDPTDWTTVPADGSPSRGQAIWTSAALVESSITTSKQLLASCSDCHTASGSDLRYFNYSNFSIRQRAIFHGITAQQDLDDLAAYIRSLNVADVTSPSQSAPGRPWWPTFQPGAGLDSQPTSHWTAGATDAAILDDDAQALTYYPDGGKVVGDMVDSETHWVKPLNQREMPVPVQFLDWNHWLPTLHPKDALGSVAAYNAEPTVQDYLAIRSHLTTYSASKTSLAQYLMGGSVRDPSSGNMVYAGLPNDVQTWYLDRSNLCTKAANNVGGQGTQQGFFSSYSMAVWTAIKMWEISTDFNLQDYGPQIYGVHADKRSWPSTARFIFDVSPHATSNSAGVNFNVVPISGDVVALTAALTANPNDSRGLIVTNYLADAWYELQLVIYRGDNTYYKGGHGVIDWGYMQGFENWIGRAARFAYMSLAEHDTDVRPIADTSMTIEPFNHNSMSLLNIENILNNYLNQPYADAPTNFNHYPAYGDLVQNYFQLWTEKVSRQHLEDWPTNTADFGIDGVDAPIFSYVVGSYLFDGAYSSQMSDRSVLEARLIPTLNSLKTFYRPRGGALTIANAVINGLARWGQQMWPGPSSSPNNWSQYTMPLVGGAPTVTATAGVGQVTLQWSNISGASSYNVKRSTSAGDPGLPIAFFVTGNSYIDSNAWDGKTYYYQVSANYDVAGQANHFGSSEGADSSMVSAVPTQGLIASWAVNNMSATAWQTVPNQVTSRPMSANMVPTYQDAGSGNGTYYMSVQANLNRWLSRSATVVATVVVNSANLKTLLYETGGIVGSLGTDGSQQAYAWGLIGSNGDVGMQYWGCSSGSASGTYWRGVNIADGKSHTLAMSRDGNTGVMEISVDGVAPTSYTGCVVPNYYNRIYNFGRLEGSGTSFPGQLMNVSIYNEAYQGTSLSALSK